MVRPGYKQTEVGEIPEDWDLRTIGDSYEFKNGLNKEKNILVMVRLLLITWMSMVMLV